MRNRRGGNGLEAWPGYVDALSTLLMVTIFVLLVFVLAEAFLSSALKGSDNTILALKQQIAALSQSLSMESTKNTTLSQELAALNAQLAQVKTQNAGLTQQLNTDNATIASLQGAQKNLTVELSDAQTAATASAARLSGLQAQMDALAGTPGMQQQLTDTQTKLAAAQKLSAQDQAEITLLNQQMAALRAQLAALQVALNAAQTDDAKDKVQITDLGKQLNEALARKVAELQQYQSLFFKAMSASLKGEKNIRVKGDRFVFESDVLFPVDQAAITPAGRAEIGQVAGAIKTIAAKIPPNVNWVLSVDGYADAQPIKGGPYKSNFDLSSARALAVLDLLVADGVPAKLLEATAHGANDPIAPGNTPADYAQNRRIEFRLTTP